MRNMWLRGGLLVLILSTVGESVDADSRLVLPKSAVAGSGLAMVGAEGYQVVAAEGYQAGGPLFADSGDGTPGGHSSTNGQPEYSDAVVAVYLRRNTLLSDGILAYLYGNDLLVPLQELMLLLEFPIVETPTGAKGWFLKDTRTFTLSYLDNEVVVEGTHHRLKPTDTRSIDGELFVSARSLSKWLPLEFLADLRAMALHVTPKEEIPLDQRRERAEKGFGSITTFRSTAPRIYAPYGLAQIPATEVDLSLGYSNRSNSDFIANGTVRAFGDLGYMNSHTWITANQDKVSNAYMRLGRDDPDGNLLGPLAATTWELGDVNSASVPLVSRTLSGRGAHISSRASSFVAEFDRITLEDTLPTGYEVELYRNNILMAAQRTSTNGKYRFENVILLRGQNDIRLEFYGPQGQRYTENKPYYVGGGQIPVGAIILYAAKIVRFSNV